MENVKAVKASRVDMTPQQMVIEFHETYGCPVRSELLADIPEADLRVSLISEELEEYKQALRDKDIVEIADALADIVYVVYGAAACHGIDLDEVIFEVHCSNMSKLDADGNVIKREDGKVLKSNLYQPPDIKSVLDAQSQIAVG